MGILTTAIGAGMRAWGSAQRNPYAWGTGVGAGLGGLYGAMSSDTSVLGGVLGGAALGFGGTMAGRAGYGAYRNSQRPVGLLGAGVPGRYMPGGGVHRGGGPIVSASRPVQAQRLLAANAGPNARGDMGMGRPSWDWSAIKRSTSPQSIALRQAMTRRSLAANRPFNGIRGLSR